MDGMYIDPDRGQAAVSGAVRALSERLSAPASRLPEMTGQTFGAGLETGGATVVDRISRAHRMRLTLLDRVAERLEATATVVDRIAVAESGTTAVFDRLSVSAPDTQAGTP